MALIEADHLVKEYKRKIPGEGMKGALYHMFHPEYEILKAVNDISFTVEEGEAVGVYWTEWEWEIYNNQNADRDSDTDCRNSKSGGTDSNERANPE